MNTQAFVAFIVLLSILLFFRLGITVETVIAIFVATLLAAIPWYFGTRDRSRKPSSFEQLFANIWVWFRRLVGLAAGFLFLWVSWYLFHTDILIALNRCLGAIQYLCRHRRSRKQADCIRRRSGTSSQQ